MASITWKKEHDGGIGMVRWRWVKGRRDRKSGKHHRSKFGYPGTFLVNGTFGIEKEIHMTTSVGRNSLTTFQGVTTSRRGDMGGYRLESGAAAVGEGEAPGLLAVGSHPIRGVVAVQAQPGGGNDHGWEKAEGGRIRDSFEQEGGASDSPPPSPLLLISRSMGKKIISLSSLFGRNFVCGK